MACQYQYSVPQFGQQMDCGFANQDQNNAMFHYRNQFDDQQTMATLDFMQLKTCQSSTETRRISYENVLTNASSLAPADFDILQSTNFDLNNQGVGMGNLNLPIFQNNNTLAMQSCNDLAPMQQNSYQYFQNQIRTVNVVPRFEKQTVPTQSMIA